MDLQYQEIILLAFSWLNTISAWLLSTLSAEGEMLIIYRHLGIRVRIGSLLGRLLELCRDGLEAMSYQVPCGDESDNFQLSRELLWSYSRASNKYLLNEWMNRWMDGGGIYSLAFLLFVSEEISVYLLKGGKPRVCFDLESCTLIRGIRTVSSDWALSVGGPLPAAVWLLSHLPGHRWEADSSAWRSQRTHLQIMSSLVLFNFPGPQFPVIELVTVFPSRN